MQAILGLIEGDTLRTFQHFVGDLLAAVRRQTMHHHRIGFRHGDDLAIDLVGAKRSQAVLHLFFLAHAGPDIGIDPIGAGHRFSDRMSDRDLRPLAARLLQNRGVRFVTLGTGQGERKRHDGGGFQPRMNHVIAVADESDLQTFELALMLDQGLAIGEHLARMVAIGERVDHRHCGNIRPTLR